MKSITIKIGDAEYQVDCIGFRSATPDTRDEPGEGGEVDLDDVVRVRHAGNVGFIGLDQFIKVYAEHISEDDLEDAAQYLRDTVYEYVAKQQEEDFDDSRE